MVFFVLTTVKCESLHRGTAGLVLVVSQAFVRQQIFLSVHHVPSIISTQQTGIKPSVWWTGKIVLWQQVKGKLSPNPIKPDRPWWGIREGCTWITRYLDGSLAILENSTVSSLNWGRLDGSIIQPEVREQATVSVITAAKCFSSRFWLTFDHHHVNVNGADRRMWQTLSLLQDCSNLTGWDSIIGLWPKGHDFPHRYSWETRLFKSELNPAPAYIECIIYFIWNYTFVFTFMIKHCNNLRNGRISLWIKTIIGDWSDRSSTRHSGVCTSIEGSTPAPSTWLEPTGSNQQEMHSKVKSQI